MSTAIAMAPSPAPHDRSSYSNDLPASSAASPTAQRAAPALGINTTPVSAAPRSGSRSPNGTAPSAAKSSPPSATRPSAPKIVVKKEPASPDLSTARHRPRKLDLSKNTIGGSPVTARGPLTARESGGLGIQEVGLACLSPGFVTQDPVMKEQLQRSMSVREQQRHIIESRLQQQSAKAGDAPIDSAKNNDGHNFVAKTPGLSRRNKAGLAIVAPSHEQFANERVIQSAPLGQTFTGRHNPHPLTRHIANQPANLASTSHIHHVPANQTNNRLPPIADVVGHAVSGHPDNAPRHHMFSDSGRGPLASPGHPPMAAQQPAQQQPPTSVRPREYKSAEEAQVELAGGRPELLPRLVHYGGHQPPTPPSPQPQHASHVSSRQQPPAAAAPGAPATNGGADHHHGQHYDAANRSASTSRRRTRAEYEDGGSPPLGNGPAPTRRGPFGAGRDSPETQRQKREEFLRLCERAWDLFHS